MIGWNSGEFKNYLRIEVMSTLDTFALLSSGNYPLKNDFPLFIRDEDRPMSTQLIRRQGLSCGRTDVVQGAGKILLFRLRKQLAFEKNQSAE